ncbi:MAG: PH domain-containing protein [Treponema sp.]|nr:PH domain-containing protein [Treponema sp.]
MIFRMTKPDSSSTAALFIMCVLLAVLFIFLVVLCLSARSYTLTVRDGRLNIQSVFYNTYISLDEIDTDGIRTVDFSTLGIKYRTNGIGIPGLNVGWFKGTAGKYKLYVTDKQNVLLIPTKKNYGILFSTTQEKQITDTIRSSAQTDRL